MAGLGRLFPLCTPPPPLYKVGQNDIYSFALLSLLCSTFCLFILLFCHFFSYKTTFSSLLSSDSRPPYLCNVQRGRCGNILQIGLLLDIVWAPPYQDNSLHFIPFATLFPETSLFALRASMRRLVQIRIEISSLLCLCDDVSFQ